jgi:pimeloyl-ACP methyl ester carboxylesterase
MALALSTALGSSAVVSGSALAAGEPASCSDSGVQAVADPGTDVPVITAHGFQGAGKHQFGTTGDRDTIVGRIANIPGVRLVQEFQHDSFINQYGTYARALAATIDCAAQKSVRAGGRGKVILVGYSMGAALFHGALTRRSTDSQRAIADEVAHVVTVADAWKFAAFPAAGTPLPTTFGTRAIAGDVTKVQIVNGKPSNNVRVTYSDMMTDLIFYRQINVSDALASASRTNTPGSGRKRVECTATYSDKNFTKLITSAPCAHGNLLNIRPVREDVDASLRAYVGSLGQLPPSVPESRTLTIGPLTMTYPATEWGNADYGASGPGEDSNADDLTNTAPCVNCDTVPPPVTPAFVQVFRTTWCPNEADCLPSEDVTGPAPSINIGGETPTSSAAWTENGGIYRGMGWCFASEQVCVTYRRATDTPLAPSAALLQLFATARWS